MPVKITKSPQHANCAALMIMAERELAAFLTAVTELYDAEQAEMAIEIWLDELEMMNRLPGPGSCEWRTITVAALVRLASRLTAAEISATPPADCSAAVLLA